MKKYTIILLFLVLKCNAAFAEVSGFEATPITMIEFDNILKEAKPYTQPVLNEIKNFDKVLELFPKRLIISEDELEIRDGNNKYLTSINLMYSGFIAYYPDDNVLYFEGGHNTDVVISIDSGAEIYETPKNRIYSPNGDYRVSSFYNGQEPSSFIQIKTDSSWKELTNQEDNSDPYLFFMVRDFHWITDNKFIFINYNGTFFSGSIVHK